MFISIHTPTTDHLYIHIYIYKYSPLKRKFLYTFLSRSLALFHSISISNFLSVISSSPSSSLSSLSSLSSSSSSLSSSPYAYLIPFHFYGSLVFLRRKGGCYRFNPAAADDNNDDDDID